MKYKLINLRREVVYTLLILMMSICYTSCQKSAINGDLDGQWQVMSIDPEPDNYNPEQRVYYCFSLHTVQLTAFGGPWMSGNILKFDDGSLALDFPYATTPQDINRLRQYGINRNPVTFSIGHLDKNRLVLKDDDTTITLRKF